MRSTWDAAAQTGNRLYVGLSQPAEEQVDNVLTVLDARPGGDGTCLEVGCGDGRMTAELARRWSRLIAVDISPEMLRKAAENPPGNVRFQLVSGVDLDGVADSCADQLICYGVLQHFPRRELVGAYLREFARVLAPHGEAIVHLPVIDSGAVSRLWRAGRRVGIVARSARSDNFRTTIEYMGTRVTEQELHTMVTAAGLVVVERAELESYFSHARNVILRLEHRGPSQGSVGSAAHTDRVATPVGAPPAA
jgi:SAM-dependent methyltransferase